MKSDQLFTYLFVLLLPSVLISFAANSVIFVMLMLLTIWRGQLNFGLVFFRKYLWFSSFMGSVLIAVLIDLHCHHFDTRQLTKRMAFVLIPFIMFVSEKDQQRFALKVLVYFMSVLSFLLLTIGLIRSWLNRGEILYGNWDSDTTEAFYTNDMLLNWGELSYKRIFLFLDMHPSYYALFSVVIVMILLITPIMKISKWQKALLLLLHTLMILLVSSKAGILSLLLVTGIGFFDRNNMKRSFAGLLMLMLIITVALSIPSTKLRINKTFVELMDKSGARDRSSSVGRWPLWHTLSEFSTKELVTGMGINHSRQKVYRLTGRDENMHNQFLQALVSSGVTGLAFLIVFLVLPLFYNRSSFTVTFLIVLSLNLLLENMLDRIWGIMLVSFFYSLFVFGKPEILTVNNTRTSP